MTKKLKTTKDPFLVKMTDFFFVRWRLTLFLWLLVVGFGTTAYTNFIKREGFPPIQFPISFITGTYLVGDKDIVDEQVTRPLYELLSSVEGVSEVQTTANSNFFSAVVFFDPNVNPLEGAKALENVIENTETIPRQANIDVLQIDPGSFLNEFDILLSVYSTKPVDVDNLEEVANFVAKDFSNDLLITNSETKKLQQTAVNPQTGEPETIQKAFNIIVLPNENGELAYYPSIVVGVDRDSEKIDIIELSQLAEDRIASLDLAQFGDNFKVVIGADFAESIENQIASLESNLFSGLLAVAVVTFLLISWRASVITGLFMVTVMTATIAILYLVGYSLNTITLFALVLSLGLFVDDATIVVESIYAHRSKKRIAREVVHEAIKKISAASFAGTMTTVLVFLPLAFLSGILGEFIRLMPVTVIIALITSLVLSITLIPVLSKFILLTHTSDGWITKHNPVTKIEEACGRFASALPRTLKTRPRRGKSIAATMILLSFVFVFLSGLFFNRVSFNIFPPSKDSDQIGFQITYPDGYTIEQAQLTAENISTIVTDTIGDNIVRITFGTRQEATARSADGFVELLPFRDREQKSPELVEKLQLAIDKSVSEGVRVRVIQFDAGPPAEQYPLKIQIFEEDVDKATILATEVEEYINGAVITRNNGTTARIIDTQSPTTQSIVRVNGQRTLEVQGSFDADDTSALLRASEEYILEKFTEEYVTSRGYSATVLEFDFGQESENSSSFASLAYAFPIALFLMYILLTLQFRSFLQPILIFTAIPFTLLGVTMGLYFTDNAFSFFVQVGLIGLIGIAVNNTILLTEYANQEKRAGIRTIDAISNAVQKRFRPLITTTLTTVVALLPLALSDPFWEALAFTIIFGLISSTILVIFSFPYYFIGVEWLRMRVSRVTRQARRKTT